MLLGIHLNLLIGPTVAVPAPSMLTEALDNVQVTRSDEGRSGFQITFEVGRSGPWDLLDYQLLSSPLLKPFNRVILSVVFNATPQLLMDGVITDQQLSPGQEPGTSTLTVTGEDISVRMDMEEKILEHPGQDDTMIATKIIASYGLVPDVRRPASIDFPNPAERIPVQHATDLRYLQTLAEPYGYVFYVTPGPVPFVNTAYWGPPVRFGVPQKALSVNMGPDTNVESISFQNKALAPTVVSGEVQDSSTNLRLPIQTFISTRPLLVSQPALPFNLPNVRTTLPENTEGLTYLQAYTHAQGVTDKSVDEVVSATGEMDALRYGDLLQPRGVVGLRGVGYSYDGLYYVKSVSHKIRKGEYKQSFTLTREGLGAITPVVVP